MSTIIQNYDARRRTLAGNIADLVATTAGPYGHNVDYHGGPYPVMYRDGLRVLERYDPAGDLEHGIKMRMQEAAQRTVRMAGDGSTTTTIILRWIFDTVASALADNITRDESKKMSLSRRAIASGIRMAAIHCCAEIDSSADRLDLGNPDHHALLRAVATLAGSNDPEIGNTIADIILSIGTDGYIMTEFTTKSSEIAYEFRPGYRMPFGVIHPSMLPRGRDSFTLQAPYCAFVKEQINTIDALRPVINAWKEFCEVNGQVHPLVLFTAAIDADAQATMLLRTIDTAHKGFSHPVWQSVSANQMPWFCVRVSAGPETWEDIESITGAKAVSSREGRGVKHFKADTGILMPSVVIGIRECVLHIDAESLDASGLVPRLKAEVAPIEDEDIRKSVIDRIARLEGRVGVVRIPVISSASRSWTAEVFDDAYKAALSACSDGICPGAGRMLLYAAKSLHEWAEVNVDSLTDSQLMGINAVEEAFECVLKTLLTNGGISINRQAEIIDALHNDADMWETIVLTDDNLAILNDEGVPADEILVDAKQCGVLDSAAAIKAAIQSACDEAATWVETSAAVISGVDKG